MNRSEAAEFTVMCMVYDGEGNLLVQDRASPQWPGIAFPGGHVEPGEAFSDAVVREVREETGLTVSRLHLCGVKQFQTDSGERYVVLLYKTDCFCGTLADSDEGRVFWVPRARLHEYALSTDFARLLDVFEDDALNEFFYARTDAGWEIRLL